MHNRFLVYVSVAAVISLGLLCGLQFSDLDLMNSRRLREWIPSWRKHGDEEYRYRPSNETTNATKSEPQNATSSAPTIPEMTLVLATLSNTNNDWVENELGDLLGSNGSLYTAIYVVNNENAPLHTPANKGHEAMAYLTYIIDFYDSLPEISLFMHGHREAWHNNNLLELSSSLMIRHLNREKVVRDGYMNLRCHWNPGCPDWLHPYETAYNSEKQEEIRIKAAWAELFPLEDVPEVLSQACCSQFAVSREAIQKITRERWVEIREWLLNTKLSDYVAGRIFEYIWQYVFNNTPVFCPDPRICYCDGYGVCFEDPEEYNNLFLEVAEMEKYQQELGAWKDWKHSRRGVHVIVEGGPDAAEEGQEARIRWLQEQLQRMSDDFWKRRDAALEVGRDPEKRARAIEAVMKRNLTAEMETNEDGPLFWKKRSLVEDEVW